VRVNVPFSPVTQWCGVFRPRNFSRTPFDMRFHGDVSSLTEFTSCPYKRCGTKPNSEPPP